MPAVDSPSTPLPEEQPRRTGAPAQPKGLVRDRLSSRLADHSSFRLGWVVAPAGSGKSWLLLHVGHAYQGPVAMCGGPNPAPRTEPALVAWLWSAIVASGAPVEADEAPTTVEQLVGAPVGGAVPVLVILDDVHLLEGSEAEAALSELIARLPERWRLVMASRVNLGFDLSRMRVSGEVVDIGADDLRFRTWEVEELFRDVYGEPLLPEDVAVLARRTSGWAAYLQLFFLATARKPLVERRSVLGSLQNRTRLVSEYLGRHVLAGLEPELQDFLIRTSVLRRPTAALCDEFLDRTGSGELLAHLVRRQLLTERLDEETYRYHAVLLSYLDAKLVETRGMDAAKREHHRAAALLEREAWSQDAIAAYARSEDWQGVARVLGHTGPAPDVLDEAWIDALPPAVLESDPLLLLVRAHQALARGALAEAVQVLRRAEVVSVSTLVAERCRRQREQVQLWADPDRPARPDWVGLIRSATQRQPLQARRAASALPGVTGRFAEGCAAFVGGDHAACARLMRAVAHHPDVPRPMAAGAALLGMVAALAAGRVPGREETARVLEEIEVTGVRWLSRLARAALVADADMDRSLEDLAGACERHGDRWGAALAFAVSGVARLAGDGAGAERSFTQAARRFAELGATAMQANCSAHAALAEFIAGRLGEAGAAAAEARSLGAAHEVPGAAGLGLLVGGLVSGDSSEVASARAILADLGTWEWHAGLAGLAEEEVRPEEWESEDPEKVPGDTTLRCLGGYRLVLGGRAVDESAAKPMERALLHLLSMRPGETVHREELIAALWPDAGAEAGLHRLQVAVSALRRLLGRYAADGAAVVARRGDGYGLVLPRGAEHDVVTFEQAASRAAAARASGDSAAEEEALVEAADLYGGPLLPGDGPAEWVVPARRRLEAVFTDSAARLGALRLERDDPAAAIQAARAGISVDRYRDDLWKTLISASERAGNHADAERARQSYEAVLEELGV